MENPKLSKYCHALNTWLKIVIYKIFIAKYFKTLYYKGLQSCRLSKYDIFYHTFTAFSGLYTVAVVFLKPHKLIKSIVYWKAMISDCLNPSDWVSMVLLSSLKLKHTAGSSQFLYHHILSTKKYLLKFQLLKFWMHICHKQKVSLQYEFSHVLQDHSWYQKLSHKSYTFSEKNQGNT